MTNNQSNLDDLDDSEKPEVCQKAENRVKWAENTPFVGNRQDEVQEARDTLNKLSCGVKQEE